MFAGLRPFATHRPFAALARPEPTPPTGPATLREALFARLRATPALTALVGARIYFNALPQSVSGPSLPAVTFYIAARSFRRNLGGPNGTSLATVRVSAWARTELEAAAMVESIRANFDGYQGLWGRVQIMGCFLEDAADLPEFPRQGTDTYTYQVALTFNVVHRVPKPVYS